MNKLEASLNLFGKTKAQPYRLGRTVQCCFRNEPMKEIAISDLKTFYTDEGEGTPVLFLHGWGGNAHSFDKIKSFISGRKICLDLWGFGQSQIPDKAWSVGDYARNVLYFIRKLGLSSVIIVGHSFGCRVAVKLAALCPSCVNRLVLISAAGFKNRRLSVKLKVLAYKTARLMRKVGFKVGLPDFASEDYKATPMKSTLVRVVNEDLSPFAARVTAPTLLIYGKSDKATPVKYCRRYHRLIRKSRMCLLNGDHFVMDQAPSAVAGLINEFIG